jgi:hypothetical protein
MSRSACFSGVSEAATEKSVAPWMRIGMGRGGSSAWMVLVTGLIAGSPRKTAGKNRAIRSEADFYNLVEQYMIFTKG